MRMFPGSSYLICHWLFAEGGLIDVFREAANVIAGNLITRLALDSSIALDVPVADRLRPCSELLTAPGTQEAIFSFQY